LVLGSGGREHALADALLASPSVGQVVVAPGNAGTTERPPWVSAEKVLRSRANTPLALAREERPDLTVVGPEAPLAEGLIDELRAVDSSPTARLAGPVPEGSKAFAKASRRGTAHGMPRARDRCEPSRAGRGFGTPGREGGLAGRCGRRRVPRRGCRGRAQMLGGRFEAARVVIEERLLGEEPASTRCDGERAFSAFGRPGHKRTAGHTGPNTGGW
jgi:phosphoribosylamine--glycine ligase